MKIIFIIIFSFAALAHDTDCDHCMKPKETPTFADKLMNWFSANERDISKAPCKTKTIPNETQMKAFIDSKLLGSFSWEVNGVQLKDESPILVQAFTDLTTARSSYGSNVKPENQKNFQVEFGINPECEKTMCALEKIYGKQLAVKILYVYLKYGFNMSDFAFEDSARFTTAEVDDVIMGLEDLPPHLQNIATKNQRLTHYTRGSTLPIYSMKTLANAIVMLFDAWSAKSPLIRQYTIFHELSHVMSSKFKDMDESTEWIELSGWKKFGDTWEADGENKCFISGYAMANPWEDFAETISAYRYNAKALQKQCPAKYNFIKTKVMNNFEYLTDKSCKP